MRCAKARTITGGFLACTALLAALAPTRALAQPAPDRFTCYRARTLSGTPKFMSVPAVSLVDRFGSRVANVLKEERLCAPADVDGADPSAPSHPDHLLACKLWKPLPHFERIDALEILNQFGSITVTVIKPDRLLVPSAKSLSAPPPAPASPVVDHFTCYKIKAASGAPHFVPVAGVTTQDQFRTMVIDVRKPKKLCTPVNKNGEDPGAENHPDQLTCYTIRLASGSAAVPTVSPVFVNDQFGPLTLSTRQPAELCVPSTLP